MNEKLLHFIWKTQTLKTPTLTSTQGETIRVGKQGHYNSHAGPDFLFAKIWIGDVEWNGHVEIHLKSSDWYRHKHQLDPAYANVILHVVWEDDVPLVRSDGTRVPSLVLGPFVPEEIFPRYEVLTQSLYDVPCHPFFEKLDTIHKINLKEKAMTDRLSYKIAKVKALFDGSGGDLEEASYQLLGRNFGFKLNADAFERLTQVLPLKLIQKHKDQKSQMEALVFGMSGLLEYEIKDDYHAYLRREFQFLGHKYGLLDKTMSAAEWKFLRTRPANFPTLRMSQWVSLLQQINSISSFLMHASVDSILKMDISASAYWREHFVFTKNTSHGHFHLGKDSLQNIMINSMVPLLAFYAELLDKPELKEKALGLLEQISAEKNHITKVWQEMGMNIENAFDSQALIHQFSYGCAEKKCLECPIGSQIIRSGC